MAKRPLDESSFRMGSLCLPRIVSIQLLPLRVLLEVYKLSYISPAQSCRSEYWYVSTVEIPNTTKFSLVTTSSKPRQVQRIELAHPSSQPTPH